jgi:hypothetical protein
LGPAEEPPRERICLTQSLIVEMGRCWVGLVTISRIVLCLSQLASVAGVNTDSEEEISASVEENAGSAAVPVAAGFVEGDTGSFASDLSHSAELEPNAEAEAA